MGCVHELTTTSKTHATRKFRGGRAVRASISCVLLMLILNFVDSRRTETFQKFSCPLLVKPWIARFNAKEEPRLSRERKSRLIENRMVGPRASTARQHTQNGGQCSAENVKFKSHWNECGPAIRGPSANVER